MLFSQASDPEEDIDVKDMVGLNMNMHEKVNTDNIPENIFEDEPSSSSSSSSSFSSPVKVKIEKLESPCAKESYRKGTQLFFHRSIHLRINSLTHLILNFCAADTKIKTEKLIFTKVKQPKADVEKPRNVQIKTDIEKVKEIKEIVTKHVKKEVEESKISAETETEDCIDVETVSEQVPGNLSSEKKRTDYSSEYFD